jgi:hypothetical protein
MNDNVSLINELEKAAEWAGQQDQPKTDQWENPSLQAECDLANQRRDARIAALPEYLRSARASALAKGK